MRRPLASSLSLCVMAIALGACAGSTPSASSGGATAASTDGATGAPSAGDSTTTVTTTAEQSGDARKQAQDPISDFLGFGEARAPSESDLAKQRQVEDLIQSCMQAEGFTYTTIDPAASASAPAPGPWSLPPEQFAATYGYGITTIDKDDMAKPNDDASDPLAGKSLSEKAAYYQALYGGFVTIDSEGNLTKRAPKDGTTPTTSGTKSCSQKASEAVYGIQVETAPSDNPFSALEGEMSAMWDRIKNDQRLVDATKKWSDCMADAGYPGYSQLSDAMEAVNSRANEVLGQNRDQTPSDPQVLTDLRAFEISVATADFACKGDFDVVNQSVTREIENAFINDHRDELERYRDAIAAGTVGKG